MKTAILASVAAAAVAFAPSAMAQSTSPQTMMAADQRSAYDTWPPERQRMYDVWTPELQAYYWTLSPDQQVGWWALNDEQRVRLYAMVPQQRTAAWNSIIAQMSGAAPLTNNARTTSTAAMSSGNIRYVSNAVVQPIAGDQAAIAGGKVPICGPAEYDNCMNAWEAGRRGPNVTKPLGYWPGHTADRPAGE